jgi:kynurenine formamidase
MTSERFAGKETTGASWRYGTLSWPQVTPELRQLIRSGRVFSLQHAMRPTMPQWEAQPKYALTNVLSHEASAEVMQPPVTGSFERIEHSGHSGTHIDALCHVGCVHAGEAHLYGNVPARALATPQGFTDLGAEHFPPILLRGILLDVPAAKGCDRLPDLYEVTPGDLQECERRQGVSIAPATAVLIRTGFESLWESEPERYQLQSAGPRLDGARYLAERGCAVTGTDTANYEVVAFPDLPAHMFLIYERGIPIIENLRLAELAAARTYEFLFIALPIAFAGATGSSLHPIAIA